MPRLEKPRLPVVQFTSLLHATGTYNERNDMITLAEIRQHLRLSVVPEEEDLLMAYAAAAEASVADYLGAELPTPMPAPVRAAILLRVADLYENREGQSHVKLHDNRTFVRLLNPYRIMAL